jgi:MFS transporter, ACDE family, multidrug resistance protein
MDKTNRSLNLQIIFSISVMAVMGLTTITPAFPKISELLNIPKEKIGLLMAVFTMPGIILTPIMGILADRFGRKRIIVPSLLLFGIAGFACTFARSFQLLLLLRFFEGIGAASLGSLNLTLIGDIYSGQERVKIMGYNAGILSIGTAAFPLIGGALATIEWYYPFVLPLLALPLGFAVLFLLKNPESKSKISFKEYLSVIGSCLKIKNVIFILLASVVSYTILFGSFLTYLPYLVKRIDINAQPSLIGMMLSGMSVVTAIVAFFLGKITEKINPTALLKSSFLLYAIALLMMPFTNILGLLFIPIVIYGVAQAFFLPSSQSLLADMTSPENRGGIMSFNRMISQIGQTIGPMLMGLILSLTMILDNVFYIGAVISIIMFIVLIFFVKAELK